MPGSGDSRSADPEMTAETLAEASRVGVFVRGPEAAVDASHLVARGMSRVALPGRTRAWLHRKRSRIPVDGPTAGRRLMTSISEAARDFLSTRRIAVTGVSRTPGGHGGNVVYRRLRDRGYEVFAVNPNATEVEGDACFPNLASIPGGVDAVVIGTRPESAEATVRECVELGVKRVWMHAGPGPSSVSAAAAEHGRQQGITVIDGGCPCMFDPAADFGHKLMRLAFTATGRVPRHV